MSLACRAPNCPLTPHAEQSLCYLHLKEDGKVRAPLLACLKEQEERGVIRMDGVHLVGADLSDMTLSLRNFRNSDLRGADFTNVRLSRVGFDDSELDDIVLEDAILEKVDLRRVRSMSGGRTYGAIFKDVFLPAGGILGTRCAYDGPRDHDPLKAESVYRNLKETYKNQGEHETSGLYYEREMDMRRQRSHGFDRFWLSALWLSCGYGERPRRAIMTSIVVVLGYALAFMALDLRGPDGPIGGRFMECAYFSTVTFTTLGYGDIIPLGAARYIAATEAFLGAWMMALFVFVFCRRMVR
ncbi:MAG: ion channel [Planctomycetota bacterium]|nr:ion channel [Planctomycetota bacterium]